MTSHEVCTNSFILVTTIKSEDHRDVATSNIKGVFLLANQEDFITVKSTNPQVDIMCEIDAKYKNKKNHCT